MEEKRCCICNKTFIGFGNNPWPISKKEEDVCCDNCNTMYVIPARIANIPPLPGDNAELKALIKNARKKLETAKEARYAVEAYLEENFGLEGVEVYQEITNHLEWCDGLDESAIYKLIRKEWK